MEYLDQDITECRNIPNFSNISSNIPKPNCNFYLEKMYEANATEQPAINYSCTNDAYPSETNEHCIKFKEVMGASYMPEAGEAIVVVHDANKQTVCYGPSKGKSGWCGTCSYFLGQKNSEKY